MKADSVPKLFDLMEDARKSLVVCEELDLAWTVKEDVAVCRCSAPTPRVFDQERQTFQALEPLFQPVPILL